MMGRQAGNGTRLERASRALARWRHEHGGRGVRLPPEMWAEAVDLARLKGVEVVARSLRIARDRLAGRVARAAAGPSGPRATDAADEHEHGFVEVDAGRVCAPARAVVRIEGRDGQRIEIELADCAAIDVVGLAQVLWSQPR